MIHTSHLPSTNGIYMFYAGDTPIYIGKSVNIKARVKSHIEGAKRDSKERAIVDGSDRVEYTVTDSEFSALLLESELIQKHKPKYNVRWRDDKSYLYIKITRKDPYPTCRITRKERDPHALYYGPFPSSRIATNILREIRKVFPYCTQKAGAKGACFYRKIGQCDPCPAEIARISDPTQRAIATKKYRTNIKSIIRILDGRMGLVKDMLHKEMLRASKRESFEEAIRLRTRLRRLEFSIIRRAFDRGYLEEYNRTERQLESLQSLLRHYISVGSLRRIECYDMSTLLFKDSTASMVVFTDGLSDKKSYRRFRIKNPQAQSDFDMFCETIRRRFKNRWEHPNLLVLDGGKPQLRTVMSVLTELGISIPVIGIAKRPDRLIVGETLTTVRPPREHEGFQLLQEMRDEAHRFAKKYHTYLRGKKMV